MNFFKNSILSLFTRIFVYLLAICISIYIARVLGPEARGAYSLLTQFVFIMVLFMDFGLQNASVYFLGKGEKLGRIYPNIISLSLIRGVIALAFLLLFLNFIKSTLLKNIDLILILIVIFSIPFKILTEISSSVILGINNIRLLNILKVVHSLLLLVTFAIFVIIFRLKLKGAILSFVFAEVFMVFVYLSILSNWFKIYLRFDTTLIKQLLNYGLRGFLATLLILLIFRLDFFLLNYFKDIKSVGFYSIAVSFAELLFLVPEVIGMILFPRLTSSNPKEVKENTMRVLRILFFILTIFTLFLYIFGSWIVRFIYGEQYIISIPLLRILLPGFLMMSLYYIFFSYFFSKNKPEIVTFIIILTIIFKIILGIILIPLWGAKGAALSSTFSYIFCAVTFIIIFLRHSKIAILDTFLIKSSDLQSLYNYFLEIWYLPNRQDSMPV